MRSAGNSIQPRPHPEERAAPASRGTHYVWPSTTSGRAQFATVILPSPINLVYAGAQLAWPGGRTRAACGTGGVRADKCEGGQRGEAPAGTFPLVSAFYRPDRIAPPQTALPLAALSPTHGWVDDPADPNYNRLVALPYPASRGGELWRGAAIYDIIVVIGYNTGPVVPGAGSARFFCVMSRGRSSHRPPGVSRWRGRSWFRCWACLGPAAAITIAP